MTKSDERMLWIRNLGEGSGSGVFDTIDAEIGSENFINGLLDYDNGAILFGPTTLQPDKTGIYKYLLRLRLPSEPEPIHSGTRKGYLFREGPIGELVAFISLYCQSRLYILSTTFGQLTSHSLAIKNEFSPFRNNYGLNVDPVIFSSTDRNLATEMPNFLSQLRLIPSKYHLVVALSANHYARALREIGIDEEMVFVRLVAAIETAALDQSISNDPLSNKTVEELVRIEQLSDIQIQELKNLLQTRKAKARFITFLNRFSSGFFEGMQENPSRTQVTPETLPSVAGAVYDARSDYLHNGYPMYLSHYWPAFPDWHMDPSVGMTWQDRSYSVNQKLPRADFFHRLVRHCLLNYFNSLLPDTENNLTK